MAKRQADKSGQRKAGAKKPAARRKKKRAQNKKKRFNYDAFLLLFAVFTATELLGLTVAHLLAKTITVEPIFGETINDTSNALYLFGTILAMTALLLLLLKMRRKKIVLFAIEALVIFSTTIIVLGTAIGDYSILAAIALILIRHMNREKIWARNLAAIIAIAGAGAYIGISLGMFPILIFIILLSCYDIIAVFGTKHMVSIGKEVSKGNFAFTIALPTKGHKFELGNGDLVVPLIVASSILANGPFKMNLIVAALCLSASFIGLSLSIKMVSERKIALPALPPQTALMLAVIFLSWLAGI